MKRNFQTNNMLVLQWAVRLFTPVSWIYHTRAIGITLLYSYALQTVHRKMATSKSKSDQSQSSCICSAVRQTLSPNNYLTYGSGCSQPAAPPRESAAAHNLAAHPLTKRSSRPNIGVSREPVILLRSTFFNRPVKGSRPAREPYRGGTN